MLKVLKPWSSVVEGIQFLEVLGHEDIDVVQLYTLGYTGAFDNSIAWVRTRTTTVRRRYLGAYKEYGNISNHWDFLPRTMSHSVFGKMTFKYVVGKYFEELGFYQL